MRKNNTFFILLFFISSITVPKIFAANKNDHYKINFDSYLYDTLPLIHHEKITKEISKKLINYYDLKKNLMKRKIKVRKDYLKLIEEFPSKKNIKSEIIHQDIKKALNNKAIYINNISELQNYIKFLSSKEYFDIYLVVYNFKPEKPGIETDEIYNWFTLCSTNSNHAKEIYSFREKILNVFLHRDFKEALISRNLIKKQIPKDLSESNLDDILCNKFQKSYFKNRI